MKIGYKVIEWQKISRFRKEFRNLTKCWNPLRTYFTYIVKINKIGKSAGNLLGFLRDYMLSPPFGGEDIVRTTQRCVEVASQ